MRLLIKGANLRLCDGGKGDILIEDGKIAALGGEILADAETIQANGLLAAPGYPKPPSSKSAWEPPPPALCRFFCVSCFLFICKGRKRYAAQQRRRYPTKPIATNRREAEIRRNPLVMQRIRLFYNSLIPSP